MTLRLESHGNAASVQITCTYQNVLDVHSAVPGYVGVHRRHPVAKDNDAHDGGGNQQLGVDAEPREVQPDLFPKVLPAGQRSGD